MKTTYFKQSNALIEKRNNKDDSFPFNTYVRRSNDGVCISKWKMSFLSRLLFLFHGNIWLHVNSGSSQPPIKLEAKLNAFSNPRDKYNVSLFAPNRRKRKAILKKLKR